VQMESIDMVEAQWQNWLIGQFNFDHLCMLKIK
jgi:hypothetical protein